MPSFTEAFSYVNSTAVNYCVQHSKLAKAKQLEAKSGVFNPHAESVLFLRAYENTMWFFWYTAKSTDLQ